MEVFYIVMFLTVVVEMTSGIGSELPRSLTKLSSRNINGKNVLNLLTLEYVYQRLSELPKIF